jgi:hypothetical protein
MWFRFRAPVVLGETATSLQTLTAVVDSANGISWTVPFEDCVFPNTDLGVTRLGSRNASGSPWMPFPTWT